MTIRLFDIEAQKTFEEEVETYDLRVKDRMDGSGISNEPWPAFPKQPEPMADSRDEGLTKPGNFYATPHKTGDYRGSTADPCLHGAPDFDGNSQSEVKGHESVWQFNANDGELESSNASPFKIKR